MNREYHKWFSPRLNRDMELLVFGHAGARAIVFPTREGRFYDYQDWRLVDAVRDKIDRGELQLFCLDSVDSESLYCRGRCPGARIARHNQFERYVLDEVLPLTERMNGDRRLTAHGCSIGAYHAVNIALRHPERFTKVVALSGRYDLTRRMGDFEDLFQGYYDENIYFHMPSHYVPNVNDSWLLERFRQLDITLAVGGEDAFCGSNSELSGALGAKGVPHRLHVWDGEAHRAYYWRRMAQLYL